MTALAEMAIQQVCGVPGRNDDSDMTGSGGGGGWLGSDSCSGVGYWCCAKE